MSCNGHADEQDAAEEAYYYHTLAQFADLIKHMGAKQVMTDMWNYQMDVSLLLEQYFGDS